MQNTSLVFAPEIPALWIGLLAAVGLVALLLLAVRQRKGLVLRLGALALLLLGLANPGLVKEDRHRLPSTVALVEDDSASNRIADRAADTRAAIDRLARQLREMEGVDVRRIKVHGGANGTELFGDLRRGLADVPPGRLAGVIAVTDGRVHDVPANPATLGLAAPFHALVTGTSGEIDRRVIIKAAPRFGLVGSDQTITFRVENIGAKSEGEPVQITVRVDGEQLDRREIRADEDTELQFRVGHAGHNFVEIQTDPLAGDLTPLNDRAVAQVEGIRQNLRVLLVSGEPHAGERTWRNLLKSDTSVDLVHFTILRPPEKQDNTPSSELSLIPFPTRELFVEKVDQFDLIILDRYQRRGVLPPLYFDFIGRYIEKGGALLIAAGPDELGPDSIYRSPLGPLLPTEPTGAAIEQVFRPALAPDGKQHPVTRDLPGSETNPPGWAPWFRLFENHVVNGQTLMTGAEGNPLLVLSHQGRGRIAMLMSDDAWLWARGFEGGGPHITLLRRLAHWLMKEPDLEEEALRLAEADGSLTVTRQTLKDSVPPVDLTLPDGTRTPLSLKQEAPGLWQATFPVQDPGLYLATNGDYRALINIGPPNPKEYAQLSSTLDALKPVAEATGGAVRRLHPGEKTASELPRLVAMPGGHNFAGSGWIGLKLTEAYEVRGLASYDLGTGLFALGLALALFGLMWWREGR